MIWRDDDIWVKTRGEKLAQLLRVDDCFQRESLPHTIAVLAADLDQNPELVAAIRARGMLVQLHAWRHDDLTASADARMELALGVEMLTRLFGSPPTVLYPPWNKSNRDVEHAAAALALQVSHRKVSLDQYLRSGGDVAEDVVNFHFWDAHEAEILPAALALYRQRSRPMKPTDYALRAAPFDAYLRDRRRMIGVEVGVDAGAHAEAMLRHLDVHHLYLVDRWPKEYHFGYCEGRLSALGFRPRFTMLQQTSERAAETLKDRPLDFVYCDEARDAETVTGNLGRWWPLLTPGGLFGYRGYGRGTAVAFVLEQFVQAHPEVRHYVEPGEELMLVKP